MGRDLFMEKPSSGGTARQSLSVIWIFIKIFQYVGFCRVRDVRPSCRRGFSGRKIWSQQQQRISPAALPVSP